jgi:hypothetical protein
MAQLSSHSERWHNSVRTQRDGTIQFALRWHSSVRTVADTHGCHSRQGDVQVWRCGFWLQFECSFRTFIVISQEAVVELHSLLTVDHNELPKNMLWTNPGGQRGRGRQKSRCIDGVEEVASKLDCSNWRADVLTG